MADGNVSMKAVDTLHLSSVGPGNLAPGEAFEINETEARQLEARGLAKRTTQKDAGAAPANKARGIAPENKAAQEVASLAKPISGAAITHPATVANRKDK